MKQLLNGAERWDNPNCQFNRKNQIGLIYQFIQDCATAPYFDSDENLPLPTFGYDKLMAYFKDEFNFNEREVFLLSLK